MSMTSGVRADSGVMNGRLQGLADELNRIEGIARAILADLPTGPMRALSGRIQVAAGLATVLSAGRDLDLMRAPVREPVLLRIEADPATVPSGRAEVEQEISQAWEPATAPEPEIDLSTSTTMDPWPGGTVVRVCNRCHARFPVDAARIQPGCPMCGCPEFGTYQIPEDGGCGRTGPPPSISIRNGAVIDPPDQNEPEADGNAVPATPGPETPTGPGESSAAVPSPAPAEPSVTCSECERPIRTWDVRTTTGDGKLLCFLCGKSAEKRAEAEPAAKPEPTATEPTASKAKRGWNLIEVDPDGKTPERWLAQVLATGGDDARRFAEAVPELARLLPDRLAIRYGSGKFKDEVKAAGGRKVRLVGGEAWEVASALEFGQPGDTVDPNAPPTAGWDSDPKLMPFDVTYWSPSGARSFVGRIMAETGIQARINFGKLVGFDPRVKPGSLNSIVAWPTSAWDSAVAGLGGVHRTEAEDLGTFQVCFAPICLQIFGLDFAHVYGHTDEVRFEPVAKSVAKPEPESTPTDEATRDTDDRISKLFDDAAKAEDVEEVVHPDENAAKVDHAEPAGNEPETAAVVHPGEIEASGTAPAGDDDPLAGVWWDATLRIAGEPGDVWIARARHVFSPSIATILNRVLDLPRNVALLIEPADPAWDRLATETGQALIGDDVVRGILEREGHPPYEVVIRRDAAEIIGDFPSLAGESDEVDTNDLALFDVYFEADGEHETRVHVGRIVSPVEDGPDAAAAAFSDLMNYPDSGDDIPSGYFIAERNAMGIALAVEAFWIFDFKPDWLIEPVRADVFPAALELFRLERTEDVDEGGEVTSSLVARPRPVEPTAPPPDLVEEAKPRVADPTAPPAVASPAPAPANKSQVWHFGIVRNGKDQWVTAVEATDREAARARIKAVMVAESRGTPPEHPPYLTWMPQVGSCDAKAKDAGWKDMETESGRVRIAYDRAEFEAAGLVTPWVNPLYAEKPREAQKPKHEDPKPAKTDRPHGPPQAHEGCAWFDIVLLDRDDTEARTWAARIEAKGGEGGGWQLAEQHACNLLGVPNEPLRFSTFVSDVKYDLRARESGYLWFDPRDGHAMIDEAVMLTGPSGRKELDRAVPGWPKLMQTQPRIVAAVNPQASAIIGTHRIRPNPKKAVAPSPAPAAPTPAPAPAPEPTPKRAPDETIDNCLAIAVGMTAGDSQTRWMRRKAVGMSDLNLEAAITWEFSCFVSEDAGRDRANGFLLNWGEDKLLVEVLPPARDPKAFDPTTIADQDLVDRVRKLLDIPQHADVVPANAWLVSYVPGSRQLDALPYYAIDGAEADLLELADADHVEEIKAKKLMVERILGHAIPSRVEIRRKPAQAPAPVAPAKDEGFQPRAGLKWHDVFLVRPGDNPGSMPWILRVEAEDHRHAESAAAEIVGTLPEGFSLYVLDPQPKHDEDVIRGGGFHGKPYRSARYDLGKLLEVIRGKAEAKPEPTGAPAEPTTGEPVQAPAEATESATSSGRKPPVPTAKVDQLLSALFMGIGGKVVDHMAEGEGCDDETLAAAIASDLDPAGSRAKPIAYCWQAVPNPGIWLETTTPEGRPFLAGQKLTDRVRQVLGIEFADGSKPAPKGKPGPKPRALATAEGGVS